VTAPVGDVRARYDWRACAISLVAAFAIALPAGFLAARLSGSTMLLTVVVTGVGTAVSRWTYVRVARPGARLLPDD
jgi:hypothetical protein